MAQAMVICFLLLRQLVRLALHLALERAGKSIAARMAMMAITTRSSIKVNAERGARSAECGVRARFCVSLFILIPFYCKGIVRQRSSDSKRKHANNRGVLESTGP